MAARPDSPSRQLSPEERAQRDALYRVTPQQFGDILKVLVRTFNSLITLNTTLTAAGSGNALAIPVGNGTSVIFNRRHLRSAQAEFGARIRQLKRYFQVSMKKTKEAVKPESFAGVYAPVYAGAALRAFFERGGAGFGPADPRQPASGNLIDLLPNAKAGWLMRNTTTLLFFAYAHQQRLLAADNGSKARSDEVMNEVFGGQIAAAAFPRFLGKKTVRGKAGNADREKSSFEAVPMSVAVQSGLVAGPVNTYEALRVAYPEFNPNDFKTFYFQNMASYNYYTLNMLSIPGIIVDPEFTTAGPQQSATGYDVPTIVAQFQRPELRQAMLDEHTLAMAASASWKALNAPAQKAQRSLRKKQTDAANRAQGRGARAQRPLPELAPLGRY